MSAFWLSAFILGIAGSLHCMGMCGPLVMAMPFKQAGKSSLPVYLLFKTIAYGCLGIFAGLFGRGFALLNWQQVLSVLAGICILIIGLLPGIMRRVPVSSVLQQQYAKWFLRMQQTRKRRYFAVAGFLNGLLPCGLVYAAFAGASVTTSALGGFTYMFLFGAGTIPALLAVIWLKKGVSYNVRKRISRLSVVVSVCIGVLLIIRGLDLGIPYLSPSASHNEISCH
ncbi:sulfite exporter TauE/SafE family protein [Sediminibacterium ginsengisoli]|uniref:Urease accessory protein UreH-like transmembrane domain-containing protein n=1 Tax=Sediminibacterium ginsengisoli TaxID=413434 RepID=A0A1T4PBC5_9BACT|nr:sulfite exporter TauE/SafE family protein [Sediminibacterium ginsengisoli]SJZ88657.1 hypothetical protein SAMN04488132_105247 [Sediminibacterium ginsengisoli]